jgi:hypothetical protein
MSSSAAYRVEPEYSELLPPLAPAEFEELRESIRRHGQMMPIIVNAAGVVLDGHHRLRACRDLGIEPRVEVRAASDDGRLFAAEVNLRRRHLTREQKNALVEKLLVANPAASDRNLAKSTGVSPTTVGKIRRDAEARGDVPKVDTRTDSKGRQQPATKPAQQRAPETAGQPAPAAVSAPGTPATPPAADCAQPPRAPVDAAPMPMPMQTPTAPRPYPPDFAEEGQPLAEVDGLLQLLVSQEVLFLLLRMLADARRLLELDPPIYRAADREQLNRLGEQSAFEVGKAFASLLDRVPAIAEHFDKGMQHQEWDAQ